MEDLCGFSPEDNRGRSGLGLWSQHCCESFSEPNMKKFGSFLSSALVLLTAELCLVCGDITDGNTEHLKREHSLMKPYQGNDGSAKAAS